MVFFKLWSRETTHSHLYETGGKTRKVTKAQKCSRPPVEHRAMKTGQSERRRRIRETHSEEQVVVVVKVTPAATESGYAAKSNYRTEAEKCQILIYTSGCLRGQQVPREFLFTCGVARRRSKD